MSTAAEVITGVFPDIDMTVVEYITGVVDDMDEDDLDEMDDIIGPLITESTDADDQAVAAVCAKLLALKTGHAPSSGSESKKAGDGAQGKGAERTGAGAAGADAPSTASRLLQAPVTMKKMADEVSEEIAAMKEVFMDRARVMESQVDAGKLKKEDERRRIKLERAEAASEDAAASHLRALAVGAAAVAAGTSENSASANCAPSKSTQNTRDIQLRDFDLAFGGKMLLVGASININFGRRYGLVGRNGAGKSTFMRALSRRDLPVPSDMSILHVEQEVVGDETIALQSVLDADEARAALVKEEQKLTAFLNKKKPESNEEEKKESESSESSETSETKAEAKTEAKTEENATEVEEIAMDTAQAATRLNEVYAALEEMEADKAPARASVILSGLQFTTKMQGMRTREFSGGWRMRLALARALFSRPTLLLLDEPTNMLDINAVLWLERYLAEWPTTLLVVSHDREFLNCVATDVIHLTPTRKLDAYTGDYDRFETLRAEKLVTQQRQYDALQMERAHMQEFIDRFRYNAKRASLVQSKIKAMEKLPKLEPIVKDVEVQFRFPNPEALGPPILAFQDVTFQYEGTSKPIFSNVNCSARMDSRIAIVGANGQGKTTLLKLITGENTVTTGFMQRHPKLKVGYFSQHFVDQLPLGATPISYLAAEFPNLPQQTYRSQLGSFGLTGELALQQISSLSGGQKLRVVFAYLGMLCPHYLVLDEPSNHADLETVDALSSALRNFGGGVLLVTHDERLINNVCSELWVCADGAVTEYKGDFADYKRSLLAALEKTL